MKKIDFVIKPTIHFSRWCNRGYGIYNSLKRSVAISVLPLAYNLLAVPMATFAQPDSLSISKNVDIDEVVVNATKRASTYSELTRVVSVVTREELGALSATSLQEVLERVAQVDVRQRGTQGVQADINFRGGTFDQTLILLNGVNISDPQTGHHSLDIPLNIDAISRIEILQGPGASEFGNGAFAGAINIITDPSVDNNLSTQVFSGEYGLVKSNVSSTFGSRKLRVFATASYDRSDGYAKNTDFDISNFFVHSVYKLKKGDILAFGGYQDKEFGAQSFYTPLYPNQYEATRTLVGGLSNEVGSAYTKLKTTLYYRKHWDRFELFRTNPPSWYAGHNFHTTDVFGAKSILKRIYRLGKSEVGVEFREENILSNVLGSNLNDSIKVHGWNAYYTKSGSRKIIGAFANQTFYLKRFVISGGTGINYNSEFNFKSSWGADCSYLFSDKLRLFMSVNRTFRLPTYTELYYKSRLNRANPNLKPETAITYESGAKWNSCVLSLQTSFFYRKGSNIIDWVKSASDTIWTTMNYSKINTYGINVNATIKMSNYTKYIDAFSLSYAYVNSNKNEGDLDSYYALDYLKHDLMFSGKHSIGKHYSFSWDVLFCDRNGRYEKFIDSSNPILTPYLPYWVVNACVQYSYKKFDIFGDVSNIFNKRVMDIANVIQPGRWFGIGLKVRFDI